MHHWSSRNLQYVETPLLPSNHTTFDERRARACQHVLAAYSLEQPVYIRQSRAARAVRKIVSRLSKLEWLSLFALVVLSIFERPVWCIEGQDDTTGAYPCESTDYPGWGHEFASLNKAFACEFALLAVQLLFLAGDLFAGANQGSMHRTGRQAHCNLWCVRLLAPCIMHARSLYGGGCLLVHASACAHAHPFHECAGTWAFSGECTAACTDHAFPARAWRTVTSQSKPRWPFCT